MIATHVVHSLFLLQGLFHALITLAVILAIIAIIRAHHTGGRRQRGIDRSSGTMPDEQAVMQRLMKGLDRMEQRIDNLETILSPSHGGAPSDPH